MKSWNEIRKAATAFSKRWKTAYDEKSQAQSFLKEFFELFGVDTVTQATFEHRVKFSDGSQGFVDCFWQGRILVEMKSKGKDLDSAYGQAMDYVRALPESGAAGVRALPRAIVVSDFQRWRFYDLAKDNALTEFKLADLRKYVTLFGFMIGAEAEEVREQDPVNRQAAEKMARLHDALKAIGYSGHELETYLVRLLFCLFAEDTSIFKPDQFSTFIAQHTAEDGSDLASKIAELFQVLNTPPDKRLAARDESIAAFPYVNGNLFGEFLPIPAFSAAMRKALLDCGALDWSKISPAIFGAMFQGVMNEQERHDLGAHYTSEENILKVIRPLFLDGLREEFDNLCLITGPSKRVKLTAFHERLASLTFLDPACGCGNFLLIAYRELRRLEMDVLEELHKDDPAMVLDVSTLCKVNVSQFYGIEIEAFPSEIAKVALWLMDHLCNLEVADRFGQYFARIPIKASPHIVCANALTMDWGSLLTTDCTDYTNGRAVAPRPPHQGENVSTGLTGFSGLGEMPAALTQRAQSSQSDAKPLRTSAGSAFSASAPAGTNPVNPVNPVRKSFSYIFGNPPFLGRAQKKAEQQAAVAELFGYKDLDFVVCWYAKANDLIQGTSTRCAFVSTNSITQGEQVTPLWRRMNAEIDFAYRTFKWSNAAKGQAAVHCVVIGFHGRAGVPSPAAIDSTTNVALGRDCGGRGYPPSEASCEAGAMRGATRPTKPIFDGDAVLRVRQINGYLVDAPEPFLDGRAKPLSSVAPSCIMGNMPLDGGNLIIEDADYADFIAREPKAAAVIKALTGSKEYINRLPRHCLWLKDVSPVLLHDMPLVLERIAKCRAFRLSSKDAGTRKLAARASLFRETRNPKTAIVIPKVSSERREYIPIGFIDDSVIVTDLAFLVPDATLYHFGILTSRMHNAWMRAVAGRMKSDYRYSKDIVYNNFIWPTCGAETSGGEGTRRPTGANPVNPVNPVEKNISDAAQMILDIRKRYLDADPSCSLATLYDPLTMPPELVRAHQHLDALVDKAYGRTFANDNERVAHLFNLYAEAVKAEKTTK